jgi:cyclic pyranopterin phosphate synthase
MTFTHLDAERHPTMVDVGGKAVVKRTAVAEAKVLFPPAVAAALRESGLHSSKGPIFDTAIVARSESRIATSPSNSKVIAR